ncbi:MAG: amino acid adenylation domain-containing protein [Cyanobacteriota bacterium]|nr:amino acid adenylation domain-containing protein [Cyanobacteriota bacterium]
MNKDKKNIEAIYPLSPMQEGMLFHTLYRPESGIYFQQLNFTLRGNLDVAAFEGAWARVVERHAALRTLFVSESREKPLQVVLKSVKMPWQNLDWQSVPSAERQSRLQAFKQEELERQLPIDRAPLMRWTLIQLEPDCYELVWSHHHLVTDGWSLSVILQEVLAFYQAIASGKEISLTPVRPYRDYIAWLQKQDSSLAKAFWEKSLDGFITPTPLVVDRRLPQHRTLEKSAYAEGHLSAKTTAALQSLARANALTLNAIVQGAWALLLSRYSGESDILFGATVSGRTPSLSGIESMVGLFINTIPVRVRVPAGGELLPWLQQLFSEQGERDLYSYSPLVEIQAGSQVPEGMPLFESLLVFENYPLDEASKHTFGDLEIAKVTGVEQTNYPLTAIVIPGPELSLALSYDADRFEADTIGRMVGHFQTLLEAIADNPEGDLGELSLLTAAEKQQQLSTWRGNRDRYSPDKCLHESFEQQVLKSPDAVAVEFESERLTYGELNARANQLAHQLRSLGVGQEVLVGICVERSLWTVVGLLGILKAGGAYVPLDPDYPQERLAYTLEDSQVSVLLTQEKFLPSLPDTKAKVFCLDRDRERLSVESQENPRSGVDPDNLAYVIYTSGSTGKPKGVLVRHRNVGSLFAATESLFDFTATDVWTLFHSYAFDFSVWELWGALLYGGKAIVVPYLTSRDPEAFYNLVATKGVTVLNQTPSAFRQFIPVDLERKADVNLRYVIFGGEALDKASLRPWFVSHGDRKPQLVNMYGITETTVHVTYYPLTMADLDSSSSSIGVPIPSLYAYILDERQQPVAIGLWGEIYVGGGGVTRGYLDRPQLTAEKFIADPFSPDPNAYLYKTGDLGRYNSKGNLEYLGRIDNQVKVRGFRIELGEIESVLAGHPGVEEAIVVVKEDNLEYKHLVSYIIPNRTSAGVVKQLLRLSGEERSIYDLPNGTSVFHLNKNETDFLYEEIFENAEYLRHGITIKAGDCIFDVGANIGMFSLFAGQQGRDIEIFAFEPIPQVFEVLRLNAELYGLNANLFSCGLSDRVKTETFTYYPNNSVVSGGFADIEEEQKVMNRFLANRQNAGETQENNLLSNAELDGLATELFADRQEITCEMRAVSDVIREYEIKQIDLLKVDVEKSEMDVLAGIEAEDWLKIKQLVVEVHDLDGRLDRISQLLEQHGFELTVQQESWLEQTGLYNIYAIGRDRGRGEERIDTQKEQNDPSEKKWNSPNLLIHELQSYLKQQLPQFMIPSFLVLQEAFPLTPNGKLDLDALRAPDSKARAEINYIEPKTDTEKQIAAVWQDLLSVERVGVDDNFFNLGGHSLLATQMISRLRSAFEIDLPLRTAFDRPTVAGLADVITESLLAEAGSDLLESILGEVEQLEL